MTERESRTPPERVEEPVRPEDTDTEAALEESVAPRDGELEGDDQGSQSALASARREAAGHRRRLRDVESERDTLAGQVETLRRAEIERIAGAEVEGFRPLSDPADLWRDESAAPALGDLVDEDGNIDADRVRAAASAVGVAHPHWRLGSRNWGASDAGKGDSAPPSATEQFGDRLRGLG